MCCASIVPHTLLMVELPAWLCTSRNVTVPQITDGKACLPWAGGGMGHLAVVG